MLNLPRSRPKMAQRRFGSDSAGSSPGSVSPTLHSCLLESPVFQTPRALSAQDEIVRLENAEASEIEPLMTEESRYESIENPNPDDQRASISLHFRGRSSRDKIGSMSKWKILSVKKTGTRRIIRPDELSSVVRHSSRTTEDSSSRRIMRLVPVFTLLRDE
ncbi:hypothetical protein P5673_010330 [Acropora cervicornis]|uniref:Uncharacterized protein n=1 Tax=Acropora cervicornis TaxID=6130 RepID=A0AAD9QR92_ACRCE|nr:hypothetical protein P5673_010330 [Acropora cervicornis]